MGVSLRAEQLAARLKPGEPLSSLYTVTGDEAWACTYAGFPIIRLGDQPERRWLTELSGTSALAVDGPHILAAGGYDRDANQAKLLQLGTTDAKTLATWRLPFTPVRSWTLDPPWLDGRSDTLHLVDRGIWQRWSVSDFVTT